MSGDRLALGLAGLLVGAAALGRRGSRSSLVRGPYALLGPPRWDYTISFDRAWWPDEHSEAEHEGGFIDVHGDEHDLTPFYGEEARRHLEGLELNHSVVPEDADNVADELSIHTAWEAGRVRLPRALLMAYGLRNVAREWVGLGGFTTEGASGVLAAKRYDPDDDGRDTQVRIHPETFRGTVLGGGVVEHNWPAWVLEWLVLEDSLADLERFAQPPTYRPHDPEREAIRLSGAQRRYREALDKHDDIIATLLGVTREEYRNLQE